MIWSDVDIKRGLAEGEISIDPLEAQAIQPASVDVRLGEAIIGFRMEAIRKQVIIDPKVLTDPLMMTRKLFEWEFAPGAFVLGVTQERIRLTNSVVASCRR
jgi:deoxycytidine triphosphate deaminase